MSAERVGHEIKRLLGAGNPYHIFMDQAGVLATILPEAIRLERLKNIIRVEHGHVGPSAIRRFGGFDRRAVGRDNQTITAITKKEGDRLALLAEFSSGHCDVMLLIKELKMPILSSIF